MFQGFTEGTLDFMWGLRLNNDKSWFEAHRDAYKVLLETPMRALARTADEGFAAVHGELDLRLHVSRIYRDARRLHGNGPYKDHLWFTLRQHAEEWTDKPVFWFELAPETWSYGLGYYLARPSTMAKLRARIDADPAPLAALDRKLRAQSEFVLEGENYARPKSGPETPLAAWYDKKSFSLIHEEPVGEAVFSPALAGRITAGFEFLLPFFRYLVTLDGDPDPAEGRRLHGGPNFV